MISQRVIVARPANEHDLNIRYKGGHTIALSDGTVVLVLADGTPPSDHDDIVGAITKLLACCAGTGVDTGEFAERLKVVITVEDHHNRIENLRCDLDMAEMGLLNQRGWKHTSSTPDCVWRWIKEIDGKMLMVDRRTALSIEGVTAHV